MVKDFVFPVNKDELLQSRTGQYFVEKIIPIRMIPQALDDARTALQTNGVDFIFQHFDTFFSVMVHGNKVELPIVIRGFSRIHKGIEMLVHDVESIFEKGNELQEEDRVRFVNVAKMLAYLVSWFMCHIDNEIVKTTSKSYVGKYKKSKKSDLEEEWQSTREKALEYIYRLLQLPLQKLWQPPIIEDSFIALFTNVCYKVLEQCKDAKQKHIRQTIFEILGTSIKKYNHGISCVVGIMQLVKIHEVLASHIAAGVIHMIEECGCNGLMKEIMKEIDLSEPSESDGRNISIFLETIATAQPNIIVPILEDMFDYLTSEHYTMRNCTISTLGAVVEKALTGDDLTQEQKDQRDECLYALQEHILDSNAYVRSKVLQVWQRLCCEGAIPLAWQGKLLAATALRLEDKSASVRKHALQLLRALLQANPFAAKLNKAEICNSLEQEEIKLRKMQTESASKSARGDKQRLELWNTFLPEIRKALKEVINGGEKKNKRQDDDDDDDDDHDDDANDDIDLNTVFEHVRQLMLKEKVLEAVKHLWKGCIALKGALCSDMENLSPEAKEEFLFLLLLKTFMESTSTNTNENAEEAQADDNEKRSIEVAKQVVNYLKSCLEFATELEPVIPMAEKLLFSTTAGDAIESCTLLGTAYQFGIAGAAAAMRDALFQVFHRDQSVRNNIAAIYKEIYLSDNDAAKSGRQKALNCVKGLIELMKGLESGQSQALVQLISTWYNNKELGSEELQILWEKFSMKSSDTDPLDSRTALMLITMIAQVESSIITGNLEVLIKVGLGPRAKTDLLLARDTCRALLKIKNKNDDIEKLPIRYSNDHEMFQEIVALLIENFTNTKQDGYTSFSTDAISVIYHLANQPDRLIKHLIVEVYNRGHFNDNRNTINDSPQYEIPFFLLSKFLYIIGHVAIKEMVHLDTSVYKELKRRDAIRKLRKGKKDSDKIDQNCSRFNRRSTDSRHSTPGSARQMLRNKEISAIMEDNGEEAVEGAVDDADAEFINDILENQIVAGDGLLTKFIPLVRDVCQNPEKYNNEDVQAAGALALSKLMTVSSSFCEESLQLLITILERSPYPAIQSSLLIGVSDLATRFPNQVEPWMKHIYDRLRDTNRNVRSTCVRVLSNLIMRDMVRVRGQISELALCVVDEDTQIRQDSRQFFKALSQKGNTLYNVIPDILSRLTDPNLDLKESEFQEIIKYVLGLLQKEKQVDSIIDKLCARFKLATTERQWRDFAYCLSLLQFGPKSIRQLIESLPLLKEKIHNKYVLKAFHTIVEQAKKKPTTKVISIELEEKVEELLKSSEESKQDETELMPPPAVPKPKKRMRRSRRKDSSDEEDEEDGDSETVFSTRARSIRKVKSREQKNKSNSDSDSEDEDVPTKTPSKSSKPNPSASARTPRTRLTSSSSATPMSTKRNERTQKPLRTSQRTSARLSKS